MVESERITLHEFRRPFAAARAAVYLAVLAVVGVTDPSGAKQDAPISSTARPVEMLNRDLVVVVGEFGTLIGDRYCSDKGRAEKLAWLRSHNPESRVILRASAGERFGRIRSVVDDLQGAGYHRITIETRSSRPLFLRRLEDLTIVSFDHSAVVQPLDDGMTFGPGSMWY
jgi:biopolymer transport protein ExbD